MKFSKSDGYSKYFKLSMLIDQTIMQNTDNLILKLLDKVVRNLDKMISNID